MPLVLALSLGACAVLFLVVVPRRRRGDSRPGAPPLVGMLGAQLAPVPAGDPDASAIGVAPIPRPGEADESSIPRWRRPSLMQARKADPRRAGDREPIRFAGTGSSVERRPVRYDLAPITAEPGEVGVTEIGVLGRGDEVEILERQGAHVRIRTPDGLEGWVHRTILGRGEDPPRESLGTEPPPEPA